MQGAIRIPGELAALFNGTLQTDLATNVADGLTIYDLDTYDLLQEVVADPSAYGFDNVTDACLTITAGIPSICATPDTYLSWDGFHPTAAGHEVVAEDALEALATPEPASWALIMIGFGGLGLVGARARRKAFAA